MWGGGCPGSERHGALHGDGVGEGSCYRYVRYLKKSFVCSSSCRYQTGSIYYCFVVAHQTNTWFIISSTDLYSTRELHVYA